MGDEYIHIVMHFVPIHRNTLVSIKKRKMIKDIEATEKYKKCGICGYTQNIADLPKPILAKDGTIRKNVKFYILNEIYEHMKHDDPWDIDIFTDEFYSYAKNEIERRMQEKYYNAIKCLFR